MISTELVTVDSAEAHEACAHEFLLGRDRSPIGTQVVDQWARSLRRGAEVIQLACHQATIRRTLRMKPRKVQ